MKSLLFILIANLLVVESSSAAIVAIPDEDLEVTRVMGVKDYQIQLTQRLAFRAGQYHKLVSRHQCIIRTVMGEPFVFNGGPQDHGKTKVAVNTSSIKPTPVMRLSLVDYLPEPIANNRIKEIYTFQITACGLPSLSLQCLVKRSEIPVVLSEELEAATPFTIEELKEALGSYFEFVGSRRKGANQSNHLKGPGAEPLESACALD